MVSASLSCTKDSSRMACDNSGSRRWCLASSATETNSSRAHSASPAGSRTRVASRIRNQPCEDRAGNLAGAASSSSDTATAMRGWPESRSALTSSTTRRPRTRPLSRAGESSCSSSRRPSRADRIAASRSPALRWRRAHAPRTAARRDQVASRSASPPSQSSSASVSTRAHSDSPVSPGNSDASSSKASARAPDATPPAASTGCRSGTETAGDPSRRALLATCTRSSARSSISSDISARAVPVAPANHRSSSRRAGTARSAAAGSRSSRLRA